MTPSPAATATARASLFFSAGKHPEYSARVGPYQGQRRGTFNQ